MRKYKQAVANCLYQSQRSIVIRMQKIENGQTYRPKQSLSRRLKRFDTIKI